MTFMVPRKCRSNTTDARNNGRSTVDSTQPAEAKHNVQSLSDLFCTYLWRERNWTLLFGTCTTWFLLDVVFYGLGISSPQTLAVMWANRQAPSSGTERVHPWNPDPTNPEDTIVDVLKRNSRRLVYTSVIGSLVGSIALVLTINRVRRKWLLQWSFFVIAIFLLATALSLRFTFASKNWRLTCAFYVICQVLFNYGPNTLTFIIPAEIFPTRYRCTLHGLSAASGKLGSVLIQVVLHHVIRKESVQGAFQQKAMKFSWALVSFSIIMALGFPVTKVFLPDVENQRRESRTLLDKIAFVAFVILAFPFTQFFKLERQLEDRTLVDKTLEDLAPGMHAATRDDQVLGATWFGKYWRSFLRWGHWGIYQDGGAGRDISLSNVSRASNEQNLDGRVSRAPSPSSGIPPSFDERRSYSRPASAVYRESVDTDISVPSVPQSQFSSAP